MSSRAQVLTIISLVFLLVIGTLRVAYLIGVASAWEFWFIPGWAIGWAVGIVTAFLVGFSGFSMIAIGSDVVEKPLFRDLFRRNFRKYWSFPLILGIAAALIGWWLGGWMWSVGAGFALYVFGIFACHLPSHMELDQALKRMAK